MERKNQKLNELSKKIDTLKETEKGMLKGGFVGMSLLSSNGNNDQLTPDKNINNNHSWLCSCSCTNN